MGTEYQEALPTLLVSPLVISLYVHNVHNDYVLNRHGWQLDTNTKQENIYSGHTEVQNPFQVTTLKSSSGARQWTVKS